MNHPDLFFAVLQEINFLFIASIYLFLFLLVQPLSPPSYAINRYLLPDLWYLFRVYISTRFISSMQAVYFCPLDIYFSDFYFFFFAVTNKLYCFLLSPRVIVANYV